MSMFYVEAAILVAISFIWYASIARVVLVRHASVRRPVFVVVLMSAFLIGMAARLLTVAEGGELDPLFWLHALNLAMVLVDLRLSARFARGRHSLQELRVLWPVAARPLRGPKPDAGLPA